ncbi:hypothetical protein K438DRAFT_644803 [Mycena galopus ATCC 62051]|nr:hypothetical protein K438DRAFT_644803 [Mycena galopus ATCC 62051]
MIRAQPPPPPISSEECSCKKGYWGGYICFRMISTKTGPSLAFRRLVSAACRVLSAVVSFALFSMLHFRATSSYKFSPFKKIFQTVARRRRSARTPTCPPCLHSHLHAPPSSPLRPGQPPLGCSYFPDLWRHHCLCLTHGDPHPPTPHESPSGWFPLYSALAHTTFSTTLRARRLISCSYRETIRFWDVPTGELPRSRQTRQLCRLPGRSTYLWWDSTTLTCGPPQWHACRGCQLEEPRQRGGG